MTITIAVERNPATEVTIEWEKFGFFYARVYENWGGEWHQTHESNPYKDEEKAKASYKRFVKRYIK
jgi:hypothetical protein